MKPKRSGGGLAAVRYSSRRGARRAASPRSDARLATHNACKTCAVGMGGQRGGMGNEAGTSPRSARSRSRRRPADMQPPIAEDFLRTHDVAALERLTSRELERRGRLGFPMLWRDGDDALPRASAGTRRSRSRADGAPRGAAGARPSSTPRAGSSNEAAFLLQLLRARLRHGQHPQLLVLLPPRVERRAGRRVRQRHRDGHARRPRAGRPGRWWSARTRRATIRG